MNWTRFGAHLLTGVALAGMLPATLAAQTGNNYTGQEFRLPNSDQKITPLAPAGAQYQRLNPNFSDFPEYVAGQAVTSVVSPDGKTLFVLTSGYNLVNYPATSSNTGSNPAESTEFVFVFDISHPASPKQTQAIQLYNTYNGIAVDPSGTAFYVAGGVDDDVHIFTKQAAGWAEAAGSPVLLGHYFATNPFLGTSNPFFNEADGLVGGNGLDAAPESCGVAISQDGALLVVANYYNDSISMLGKVGSSWKLKAELDLRPGKAASNPEHGVAGGEYPYWVVVKGSAASGYTAYVSSIRDREVDVVTGLTGTPVVSARIAVKGQPNKMTIDGNQQYLYVAEDNSDSVGVIDTGNNSLVENIAVTAPAGLLPRWFASLKGNDTNSVTLTPDGTKLYVTNGWMNDVAVVDLHGPAPHAVSGLIPTGWYPTSVSFSGDGSYVYVINDKSPTGPNDANPSKPDDCGTNCYDLQLIKAGLQIFPVPTSRDLERLTEQVADNNKFQGRANPQDDWTMAALRQRIQHVIYIIKENRTYDQVLGDLPVGNGDPSDTEWGEAVTPNLHALASQFVDLDNFYDTSEVSMDGWPWSTSAHAVDTVERQTPVNYAARCVSYFPPADCTDFPGPLTYDSEGSNRNVNVGVATLLDRETDLPLMAYPPYNDPDLLPGTNNAAGPDGPEGQEGAGFLWDAALRAGKTVRDHGMFIDEVRYQLAPFGPPISYYQIPVLRYPFAPTQAPYDQVVIDPLTGMPFGQTQVAYSTSPSLQNYTDPYFRGFDQNMADLYLYQEWARDVDANGLANLDLIRLPHDHTGSFSTALDGVNTPELQTADNDYAVGLVAQKIASSPAYRDNTLIFVIEDDSQDGVDHVDSHRSIAFVVGPYVKKSKVISEHYTTLSMYRTIEDILGIGHSNLNDALANPMTAVFDLNQDLTKNPFTFTATPSPYLYGTTLIGLPPMEAGLRIPRSTHDATYWSKVTAGMDFSKEDDFDFARYNHILWEGLMGSKPYPSSPSGLDLRANREELLRRFHADLDKSTDRATPAKQTVRRSRISNTKSGI
jgi:YVTN family beta-propeller protein